MRIILSLLAVLAATSSLAAAPDLAGLAARHEAATLADRRWLHQHPELSGREVATRAYLAERLGEIPGVEMVAGDWGLGLVAVLRGALPGPVIAWRADMDALPITETVDVPFASTRRDTLGGGREVGVMHACGHDIHMSVSLGALRVLAETRGQLAGTIVWIFQPAEETGEGAFAMIEAGVLEVAGGIDRAFALHDHPTIQTGQAGVCAGPATANVDGFRLTVRGSGGHGAYPHTTIDPVSLAARIVLALEGIVAREIDPNRPAVISIGSIQGGAKSNVIPDEVVLEATVRTRDPETRALVQQKIERTVRGLAAAAGAPEPELLYDLGTPAGRNAPALSHEVVDVMRRVLGEENVVDYLPGMGGEDFGRFSAAVPGVQFRLGVGRPDREMDLHNPDFDPDERSVGIGVRLVAEILWDQTLRP
jgi:amidohydrolase